MKWPNLKSIFYWVIQGLKFLDQPQCSLYEGQNLTLSRGSTFLPLLMNYLELQIHFTQAGNLWWDPQNASLTIVEKTSTKKFSMATQKGQKSKYQFDPFQLENFEIFTFLYSQVWLFYQNFKFGPIWTLIFLAFMLWPAKCISDWFSLIASVKARFRLGQNYWAWSDPLGSREYPHDQWPHLVSINEAVPGLQTFSTFCFPTLYTVRRNRDEFIRDEFSPKY